MHIKKGLKKKASYFEYGILLLLSEARASWVTFWTFLLLQVRGLEVESSPIPLQGSYTYFLASFLKSDVSHRVFNIFIIYVSRTKFSESHW